MSEKKSVVFEIESLNLEDLDVEELERRLELAPACAAASSWDEGCGCEHLEVKCETLKAG